MGSYTEALDLALLICELISAARHNSVGLHRGNHNND